MEKIEKTGLGRDVMLNTSLENALALTVAALKDEGFGVLTEIDVQATIRSKLGLDFRPYRILGACNPNLAHRALSAAPEVGLLLPCNVTVAEESPGEVRVSLVDPLAMLAAANRPELEEVAQEAGEKLARVAAALAQKKE